MKFHLDTAEIYVPDHTTEEQALSRTSHLCFAAHQDDIEIMAAQPILECFQQDDKWFTGVVVTDGRGSPRDSLYKDYTDEEMRLVRFKEQRKAAVVGEFGAQIMLDIPSKEIKDASQDGPVEDILAILQATKPKFVYTHNLVDKHDTHVAVALRVIEALRKLADWLTEPFFQQRPPRSTGRELFGIQRAAQYWSQATHRGLGSNDILATLTALTARSIEHAYRTFLPTFPDEVIVSGGGARNTTLMGMLAQCLSPAHVTISDEYGLGIEAKEAVAFAVLAYETWHKRPGNIPAATGASRAVVLGSLTY